jgi:predicted  nucleic acid-binding Zn-ribbon protein
MSLEAEFSEILVELSKFQSAIGRVHEGLKSPKEAAILGDLLTQIDKARNEAQTAVPAAIQRISEVAKDVQQRAEEQRKKLAELQQQIEERKKNPPQPPTAPPKPELKLEPHLGAKLAAELLQHVAPTAAITSAESSTQVIKEIWEDWNWDNQGAN